jgi:hypothetical protein
MASAIRPPASEEIPSAPAVPGFCTGAALCIEAFRVELARLHDAALAEERPDGCAHIHHSLRELAWEYSAVRLDHASGQADSAARGSLLTDQPETIAEDHEGQLPGQARQAWDPPGVRRPGSHADASFGTDDVDDHNSDGWPAMQRMTTMQVLEVLDRGIPSAMEIELTPNHGTRTFDVQRDVASLVCRRSVAALAIRLRWPCAAIAVLGGGAPFIVLFAERWATGGVGQFAIAYALPLWLEVWLCVGYWLLICMELLWYASMQRELAWMTLKRFSTLWIFAMTGVFVAGYVSLFEFGVHRSTWIGLPVYIACALLFPLIAMADALPPKLRLIILRFASPFALGCVGLTALVLRLPTAEGTPGKLVWTVMGTDTVTNLQALTYSATVMTVLLTKGVLRAWVFPDQLAFIETSLIFKERAVAIRAQELQSPLVTASMAASTIVAGGATASVTPHLLFPGSMA